MTYKLKPGEVVNIDVKEQRLITLLLNDLRPQQYHAMPWVKVTEEYGGFSVEIKSVKYTGTWDDDTDGGETFDLYEVNVSYSHIGGENGGSRISVGYPYSQEVATAHLFKNI